MVKPCSLNSKPTASDGPTTLHPSLSRRGIDPLTAHPLAPAGTNLKGAEVDILPALKSGDSLYRRAMPRTGKDI